jgi:hypothetical protein
MIDETINVKIVKRFADTEEIITISKTSKKDKK